MNPETARDKLIKELITVGSFLVTAYITRKVLNNPDFGRAFQMRTALVMKRVADSQVKAWENVATRAANTYQKARI